LIFAGKSFMNEAVKKIESIFVLKHNILLDAFRPALKTNKGGCQFNENFKNWRASIFVVDMLIYLRAEHPDRHFGITSKQAWDMFTSKFLDADPSDNRLELLSIFKDCVKVVDNDSVSKLSLDESLFVISDTLYTSDKYNPVLISNTKDEKEKAELFYNAKGKKVDVPFIILDAVKTEEYLRALYPVQSALIDKNSLFKR